MKQKKKTKVERRIAIIKDAIAQLKARRYRAVSGSYIVLPKFITDVASKDPLASAQKLFSKLSSTRFCEVCAKGSLFISLVNRENELPACEIPRNDHAITTRLTEGGLFSSKNIALVEIFYESWNVNRYADHKTGSIVQFSKREAKLLNSKVEALDRKYIVNSREAKLLYILRNMLKNKGVFKP